MITIYAISTFVVCGAAIYNAVKAVKTANLK